MYAIIGIGPHNLNIKAELLYTSNTIIEPDSSYVIIEFDTEMPNIWRGNTFRFIEVKLEDVL